MSLTGEVKAEIARPKRKCCKRAFLSGLIHTAATLNFSNEGLSVIAHGEGFICNTAREVFISLYDSPNKTEKDSFVFFGKKAAGVLADLGILTKDTSLEEGISPGIVKGECCVKAYIAGAFLGCGGVFIPVSGYSLEFTANSAKLSHDLAELLGKCGIKALNAAKNGRFRCYIKDKEAVSDALALMGANKAVLKVNSLAAERELRRDTFRKANCDLANVEKTVNASLIQLNAIKNIEITDAKLKEAAEARLKYPDASYDELKDILKVSKSTVKYRLNKIVELYNKSLEDA